MHQAYIQAAKKDAYPMPEPVVASIVQGTLGRVIDKLADKYLPSSLSEKEREEFRIRALELALKEAETEARALESVNATIREEGRSEHWMRWSWRPLIGFTFAGVIVNNYIFLPYFRSLGLQPIDIPSGIWESMLVILGVAAGTRGLEKWARERK